MEQPNPTPPSRIEPHLHPSRVPVLRHVFAGWRLLRRWFSRREFTVRLLNLPLSKGTADQPGLILLQIDGLARSQLERAIQSGRMPFVKELVDRERFQLHTMYSGQPATTPAVLGELFYGVPQAVAAFSFRDHRSGEVVEMLEPDMAATIQGELEKQGRGLLTGGSAYCDIYTGGAAEAQFCPANMRWNALDEISFWKKALILLLNVPSVLRMIVHIAGDLVWAVWDCLRSRIGRQELFEELKFIPRRLIGGVILRELTAIAAEADAIRGLPIIHANFLGYDECGHRRGPDTDYAHRALGPIDRSMRRIWNAAHGSRRRDYSVWLMSDHGQERTIPYEVEFGRALSDAVNAVFESFTGRRIPDEDQPTSDQPALRGPLSVAIGPLGYIYWPDKLSDVEKQTLGPRLASEASIPLVLACSTQGVSAWTQAGKFELPRDAERILAQNHPFLQETANDLVQLCSHPDAGDFLICGWRNDAQPVSFVYEHGAHAGPGPQETSGFLLTPPEVRLPNDCLLRPSTLRTMALGVIDGETSRCSSSSHSTVARSLRLVTYNIHSCIGLDGRLSPTRIARVLASLSPDVIALQEVDVGRARSGGIDQAKSIATALEMELNFHSCMEVTGEKYGNAILSRLPMTLKRAALLPGRQTRSEPRGALWVAVDFHGETLNVITTHLGLTARERRFQVEALLGTDWLEHPECRSPVVLCGDLNLTPRSDGYRRIAERLKDAQTAVATHRPGNTWFSPLPLTRLDHVFVSEDLTVMDALVAQTARSRVASDHLPVVIDLELPHAMAGRDEC